MPKRTLQGRITFRLPEDEEKAIFEAAKFAGMHIGGWIRQSCKEKIEKDYPKSADKA